MRDELTTLMLLTVLTSACGPMRGDAPRADASPPDATVHDGGRVDAGAHDAGAHDGGAHDAGAHDAGAHDAGAHDAARPDLGGACVDTDGDGFQGGTCVAEALRDCDDADRTVRPGTSEVCNGVDDDCDGTIDDGLDCARTVTLLRDFVDAWFVDVAVDGAGNLYILANAAGALVDVGGGAVHVPSDEVDTVVASYAPDGAYRWAQWLDGPGGREPTAIATDGVQVYAMLRSLTYPVAGVTVHDGAVVALDAATGALLHVTALGDGSPGMTEGLGGDLVMAPDGDVVALTTMWTSTYEDVFVERIHPDGSAAWARRYADAGPASQQSVRGGAVSPSGEVFLGVVSIGFGGPPVVAMGGACGDVGGGFVASLDADGECLWARAVTGDRAYPRVGGVDASTLSVGLTMGGPTAELGGLTATGAHAAAVFQLDSSDGAARAVTLLDTDGDDRCAWTTVSPSGEVLAAFDLWRWDEASPFGTGEPVSAGFVGRIDAAGTPALRDVGMYVAGDWTSDEVYTAALAPDGSIVAVLGDASPGPFGMRSRVVRFSP